ncbi:Aste57867_22684 [Aphanomyces stellatus]|uniref:Aste57867_22684 protein n=1 Tax=Aphanomyces stellatus TaxID=120398 RepID=A0A485LKM1_9STRA|nr:hypothetical protein As57867_022614 [Aphanomyces stellatus]VFT99338.1 Aste57867_22684 [Aphanomyces stellatus]
MRTVANASVRTRGSVPNALFNMRWLAVTLICVVAATTSTADPPPIVTKTIAPPTQSTDIVILPPPFVRGSFPTPDRDAPTLPHGFHLRKTTQPHDISTEERNPVVLPSTATPTTTILPKESMSSIAWTSFLIVAVSVVAVLVLLNILAQ